MGFFDGIKPFLPNNLSDSTVSTTRATIGAVAAYAVAINPLAGVLVLLGHGAWEYAGLYMQSIIDQQQHRIENYSLAFSKLVQQAKELGVESSETDIEKAKNIFLVHNIIEEVCYQALAEIVKKLNIRSDKITREQSDQILAYVKEVAHVELRKEGGYSQKGREMITPQQFDWVIKNVNTIIHDRDGRLTDARYYSLTDLCTALDDHNSYVKNILFSSWFHCRDMTCPTHLPMIKNIVHFNKNMSAQLGFNFEEALEKKKEYYDTHYPKLREVECSKTKEKSALKFVNITEVRAAFSEQVNNLLICDPDKPFTQCLIEDCAFSKEKVEQLTQCRSVTCAPRYGFGLMDKTIPQPPLLQKGLTVGEFLTHYFPEMIEQVQSLTKI